MSKGSGLVVTEDEISSADLELDMDNIEEQQDDNDLRKSLLLDSIIFWGKESAAHPEKPEYRTYLQNCQDKLDALLELEKLLEDSISNYTEQEYLS